MASRSLKPSERLIELWVPRRHRGFIARWVVVGPAPGRGLDRRLELSLTRDTHMALHCYWTRIVIAGRKHQPRVWRAQVARELAILRRAGRRTPAAPIEERAGAD